MNWGHPKSRQEVSSCTSVASVGGIGFVEECPVARCILFCHSRAACPRENGERESRSPQEAVPIRLLSTPWPPVMGEERKGLRDTLKLPAGASPAPLSLRSCGGDGMNRETPKPSVGTRPSHPAGAGKGACPHYVIPAQLVLVKTGSGNPVVGWVERNETHRVACLKAVSIPWPRTPSVPLCQRGTEGVRGIATPPNPRGGKAPLHTPHPS